MTTHPSGGVPRHGQRDSHRSGGSLLTPAEREARAVATYYARREGIDDAPETAYERVLPRARWAVLQRLIRGLLRERPEAIAEPAVCGRWATGAIDAVVAEVPGLDPEAVHDRIEDAGIDAGVIAVLPFPAASTALVVPVGAVHGFDRYRLAPPAASVTPMGGSFVTHPTEVVTLLAREGAFADDERTDAFRDEVEESVANVALALLADRHLARTLPVDDPWSVGSTAPLERFAAVHAHPVHPCAKTRLGMTAVESLAYAAEFTDRVDLRFVAVERGELAEPTAAGEPPLSDALVDAVDGLEGAIERVLPSAGDYRALPVHPWQYQHVVPALLEGPAGDHVVPLPDVTAPATPLGNLRTLVLQTGEERPPHVKLPVDVLKTSHWRTLPPAEVHDGPAITDLLRALRDRGALGTVQFLAEPAAACLDPEHYGDAIARQLSALVRQNPYTHPDVEDSDAVVPATSLLAPRPGDRPPLLVPIVARYAQATGEAPPDAAASFLADYVDVLVPDVLRLLAGFGVGPEAHQQNTLLVFDRDARPRRALVRDFGGFRIDTHRLRLAGHELDLYPGSNVDAGPDGMYEAYAELFQVHVGELVLALVRHLELDEGDAWARIRRRCGDVFDILRADSSVPDVHVDRDEARLFSDRALRRGWTSMRLAGAEHDPIYASVPNPLSSYDLAACWDDL